VKSQASTTYPPATAGGTDYPSAISDFEVEPFKVNAAMEVQMSDRDLELLITMDDPGEDTLEEDTFHLQADEF